jgi:hypothetical protein
MKETVRIRWRRKYISCYGNRTPVTQPVVKVNFSLYWIKYHVTGTHRVEFHAFLPSQLDECNQLQNPANFLLGIETKCPHVEGWVDLRLSREDKISKPVEDLVPIWPARNLINMHSCTAYSYAVRKFIIKLVTLTLQSYRLEDPGSSATL